MIVNAALPAIFMTAEPDGMNSPFYQFSHSARILKPFAEHYDCGWFDGGCFVFACALQRWLGGRLAVIVRQELLREQTFDHVVLSLPDPLGISETLYVDADGVTTAPALLKCWKIRERLQRIVLEDPADNVRFVSPLWKESWSTWLAKEFEAQFGKPLRADFPTALGRME